MAKERTSAAPSDANGKTEKGHRQAPSHEQNQPTTNQKTSNNQKTQTQAKATKEATKASGDT